MTSPVSARQIAVIEALMQEAGTLGYGETAVAPHDFVPLRRWRNRGRCARCLCHEEMHPAVGWMPARPLFDSREAIRV